LSYYGVFLGEKRLVFAKLRKIIKFPQNFIFTRSHMTYVGTLLAHVIYVKDARVVRKGLCSVRMLGNRSSDDEGLRKDRFMIRMTVNDFYADLNRVVDKTATDHATVLIEGQAGNAVMISEEDWNSINDILQVVSMSGMAESIREGLQLEIIQTAEHID